MFGSIQAWIDNRLGLSSLIRSFATGKRPPRGTSWFHTLGFAALMTFVLMALTGLALAFHFVPSSDHAYDSIRVMERDVAGGALVRGLHHWGASAMVVLAGLHLLRVFFHGAYKAPREFTWLLGLGLLGVVIGFGFTGYLLPWDQKAYFATKIGVNLAGHTPFVGEEMKHVLYGGPELGPNTLSRFFVIHVVVLPGVFVALLALHLWQIQRHGISPVGKPVNDPGEPGPAYHPHHTFKEAIVAIFVIGALFALAILMPAQLEAEASASDRFYEPRPDWYFYAPFQFLKYFPGEWEALGAFYIPGIAGGILAMLPFIDRNPERRFARRKLAGFTGIGGVIAVGALTLLGAMDRPSHFDTPPHPLGADPIVRLGYDLVRTEGCFQCHTLTADDGRVFGRLHEEEPPDLRDIELDPEELTEFLLDPESDVMKPYPHLDAAKRRAIGVYLEAIR